MIYIFDIDGTLTPSRNKMDKEFQQFFKGFMETHKVWLISGSDKDKTIDQIGEEIWRKAQRAYQCSGNQLYQAGELIKENKFELPIQTRACLEAFLTESKYPHRYGNHIEERPGMVNFSVVGRNCTQKQREHYFAWDKENKERKEFAWELRERYSFLEVTIGGEISIDITEMGKDKGQIIYDLHDVQEDFTFFGDKLKPGGNDYSMKLSYLHYKNTPPKKKREKPKIDGTFHPVETWRDTKNLLYSIILSSIL